MTRPLNISTLRSAAKFLLVLAIPILWLIIFARVKELAHELATDTLPGLSYAGKIISCQNQGFNEILLLLQSDTPARIKALSTDAREFDEAMGAVLLKYKKAIYEPEDHALFDNLLRQQKEYLIARQRVLNSVGDKGLSAADALGNSGLQRAYELSKEAEERLFEYNRLQGISRGREIQRNCLVTQWATAGLAVVLFIMGFFTGVTGYIRSMGYGLVDRSGRV